MSKPIYLSKTTVILMGDMVLSVQMQLLLCVGCDYIYMSGETTVQIMIRVQTIQQINEYCSVYLCVVIIDVILTCY